MPDMSKCFSHHTNRENPLTRPWHSRHTIRGQRIILTTAKQNGGACVFQQAPPMSVAESVSPDGLVVGVFPHVLVDVLPIVLVGCYPDGRGCRKDGEMFDLEHAHSGLDIFLLHDAVLLHLMITFIVLLPRFTMLMPRCGVERRLPFRS